MKSFLSRAAALVFLFTVAAYPAYKFLWPVEKFNPDVQTDVIGKFVAVPANDKPGELRVWNFSELDTLKVTQLDSQIDGRKRVVYCEVVSRTSTGYKLTGILEAHYVMVAKVPHLVALGSISLSVDEPAQKSQPVQPNKKPSKPQEPGVIDGASQPLP